MANVITENAGAAAVLSSLNIDTTAVGGVKLTLTDDGRGGFTLAIGAGTGSGTGGSGSGTGGTGTGGTGTGGTGTGGTGTGGTGTGGTGTGGTGTGGTGTGGTATGGTGTGPTTPGTGTGSGCTLAEAILERQKAYGITDVWDAGDPTNTAKLISTTYPSYTLTHYKAYVNAIAEDFISGTYTGGASAPVMCSATYASAAADEAALLTLTKALRTTLAATSRSDGTYKYGHGEDETWAEARTLAEAAFDASSTAEASTVRGASAYSSFYELYRVELRSFKFKLNVSGMSSALDKTLRWFAKTDRAQTWTWTFYVLPADITDIFDDHGYLADPTDNQYSELVASTAAASASSATSGWIGSTDYPGTTEPGTADENGVDRSCILTDEFALIDWDFACT